MNEGGWRVLRITAGGAEAVGAARLVLVEGREVAPVHEVHVAVVEAIVGRGIRIFELDLVQVRPVCHLKVAPRIKGQQTWLVRDGTHTKRVVGHVCGSPVAKGDLYPELKRLNALPGQSVSYFPVQSLWQQRLPTRSVAPKISSFYQVRKIYSHA